MLELIKIEGLNIKQRIEKAKRTKDKGCFWSQDENIFIREYRGNASASVDAFCHHHEDYEILIPLSPLPCLVQDENVVFGEVGFCYPIPSHTKHGFNNKLTDVSYIIVVFNREWFLKILNRMQNPIGAMKRFFCSNIIKDLIKMFQSIFKQDFELKEYMLNTIGKTLLVEMIRQNFVEYKMVIYKKKEYQKGIQYIVNYINDNYTEDISINSLAQMCEMSKYHFIRSFKNFTSVPPLKYLYKIRCSRAKYLFENTNSKIKDVAKTIGFKSSSSFAQVFKRHYGLTPVEYISQLKNGEKNEDKN